MGALDGDATSAQAPAKFRRRSSPSGRKVMGGSAGKPTSPGVVVLSPSLPDGEDDQEDRENKRVSAPVASETSAQSAVPRPVFAFGRGRFPAVRPPVGAESHVEDLCSPE